MVFRYLFLILVIQTPIFLLSDISEVTSADDSSFSSVLTYSPSLCSSCTSQFRSESYILKLCQNETQCIENFMLSKKHLGTCLAMNYCFPSEKGWKTVCICSCINDNYYKTNLPYQNLIDCFLNKNCGGVGGCVGTVITENNFAFNIELGIKYYILLLLTIFLY